MRREQCWVVAGTQTLADSEVIVHEPITVQVDGTEVVLNEAGELVLHGDEQLAIMALGTEFFPSMTHFGKAQASNVLGAGPAHYPAVIRSTIVVNHDPVAQGRAQLEYRMLFPDGSERDAYDEPELRYQKRRDETNRIFWLAGLLRSELREVGIDFPHPPQLLFPESAELREFFETAKRLALPSQNSSHFESEQDVRGFLESHIGGDTICYLFSDRNQSGAHMLAKDYVVANAAAISDIAESSVHIVQQAGDGTMLTTVTTTDEPHEFVVSTWYGDLRFTPTERGAS